MREAHRLRAETASRAYAMLATYPISQRIRALHVPVLIIRSDNDDEPFAIAKLLPEIPAVTVPKSSAWIMLDQPLLVNTNLDAFLTTLGLHEGN